MLHQKQDSAGNSSLSSEELNAAFAEYLRQLDDGAEIDKVEFAARYPGCRDQLLQLMHDEDKIAGSPALLPQTAVMPGRDAGGTADLQAAETEMLLPKSLGEFQLGPEIGRGGMGIVLEARQTGLGRRVAIKLLPHTAAMDRSRLRRFRNEVAAAGQLDHEHIVPVYASDHDHGWHYYAMKYIDGTTLASIIKRLSIVFNDRSSGHSAPKTSLPSTDSRGGNTMVRPEPDQLVALGASDNSRDRELYFRGIASVMSTVCDALHHAHEMGIVHRDVKPANLMLDASGKPWVLDFGLAQIVADPGQTMTGTLVGTLRYMSPEQALARRIVVDHRTDVYSLGVTMYELITLREAFSGDSKAELLRLIAFEDPRKPRSIRRDIPEDLQTIALKAMSKNPDDRYDSAAEMSRDLRHYLHGEPIHARPPGVVKRLWKWTHRHRTAAIGAAVVMLTAACGAAAFGYATLEGARRQARIEARATRQALRRLQVERSLRLASDALRVLPENPGLAVRLATEGCRIHASADTRSALLAALDENHELRRFAVPSPAAQVAISNDGRRMVASSMPINLATSQLPASVIDLHKPLALTQIGQARTITSAVFSPPGGRILTVSAPPPFQRKSLFGDTERSSQDPEVWDAASGERLYKLDNCFAPEVHPQSFNRSGQQIVVPSAGFTASVFDAIEGGRLHQLTGHKARVICAGFSPVAPLVVTVTEDNVVRLFDVAPGGASLVRSFDLSGELAAGNPRSAIARAVFSPDGTRLLLESGDARLTIRDVTTGKRTLRVTISGQHARFLADGTQVISQIGTHGVEVRDASSGSLLLEFPGRLVAVSRDDRFVAAAAGRLGSNEPAVVRVYRLPAGGLVAELRGHDQPVLSACFTTDGTRLMTGGADRTLRLWSLRSGRERRAVGPSFADLDQPLVSIDRFGEDKIRLAHRAVAQTIVWDLSDPEDISQLLSRPGSTFPRATDGTDYVLGHDGTMTVMQGTEPLAELNRGHWTSQDDLHSHAGLAVVRDEDRQPWLWNFRQDQLRPLIGHSGNVTDITLHPEGTEVATAGADGQVFIRDTASLRLLATLTHDNPVDSVRFSADGTRLATLDANNVIRIWDRQQPSDAIRVIPAEHSARRVEFAPDGLTLISQATRQRGQPVQAFDLATGELRHSLAFGNVESLRLHSTLPLAAAASDQGVMIWNYATGEEARISRRAAQLAVLSQDGKTVVVASQVPRLNPMLSPLAANSRFAAPHVDLYALDGTLLRQLAGIRGEVLNLAVAGDRLVLSERRFQNVIFDPMSGKAGPSVPGHPGPTCLCQLTADGRFIVQASWDGTATVVDAATGQVLHELIGHAAPITAAALAPGLLITGASDGQVLTWNLESGERGEFSLRHATTVSHVLVNPNGSRVLTASIDGEMKMLDLTTGLLTSESSLGQSAADLSFSPDGKQLVIVPGGTIDRTEASGGHTSMQIQPNDDSKHVRIVGGLDGKPILLTHTAVPLGAAWSPAGRMLLTWTRTFADGKPATQLMVWRADTGLRLHAVDVPSFVLTTPQWIDDRSLLIHDRQGLSVWSLDQPSPARLQRGTFDGLTRPGPLARTQPLRTWNPDWILASESGQVRRIPLRPEAMRETQLDSLTQLERQRYRVPDLQSP